MPLAGYQPETREIALSGDNSFRVRGLSLNDLTVLIRVHFDDLDALFDLFDNAQRLEAKDLQPLAVSLVTNAPGFAANVIALAAGEGTAADAERLPFPTQVAAMLEIGNLTFSEVGGVGTALELVAGLLKKTNLTSRIKTLAEKKMDPSSASTLASAAM